MCMNYSWSPTTSSWPQSRTAFANCIISYTTAAIISSMSEWNGIELSSSAIYGASLDRWCSDQQREVNHIATRHVSAWIKSGSCSYIVNHYKAQLTTFLYGSNLNRCSPTSNTVNYRVRSNGESAMKSSVETLLSELNGESPHKWSRKTFSKCNNWHKCSHNLK